MASPHEPRMSPIARLRHARRVHEQLTRQRQWASDKGSVVGAGESDNNDQECQGGTGVEALATELQKMLRQQQESMDDSALMTRVEKIGSREKDALVVHLLRQVAFFQAQRDDVVAVGEKLASQLVQQQHELHVQFNTQQAKLERQLQHAIHRHPEVARLEAKIAELERANAESEQKLLFAVQKLHRSRRRERELRLEQESDPRLWGL